VVIPQIWGCERASARSHPQIWGLLQKFLESPKAVIKIVLLKNENQNKRTLRFPPRPWFLICMLAVCLNACQPAGGESIIEPKWVYTDLRILDQVDAPAPEQDFMAGYLRVLGPEIQIRLDFLDLDVIPTTDLYLALDSVPGGASELPWHIPLALAWDALLVIPAAGEMQVLAPNLHPISGSGLRVVRDSIQDSVTISLLASSLPGGGLPGRLQVFSTDSGSTIIRDELGTFLTDDFPPKPAPVLLAFWDTLPAYTPALGLRRWDGAHTGPSGGRHGLYNLLRTARARQMPVALLDLKTPSSLAALDYVGGLGMVIEMAEQGQLILPTVQPGFIPHQAGSPPNWLQTAGWIQPEFAIQNRQIEAIFGLPASQFTYSPAGISSELPLSGRVIFTFNPTIETAQLARWQQQLVIELPPELPAAAPTINGPDLSMRRQIIQAALSRASQDGTALVVLGGDLPGSAWGNPEIARATFNYLASHPWIQLLHANDLVGLPTPEISVQSLPTTTSNGAVGLLDKIETLRNNNLAQAAWQAYASLYDPVYPHPPEFPALREGYLGTVQVLLFAARWADQPYPVRDCSQDIDLDGQPECLLGDERLLTVIQPENGELTYVFALGMDGPHQLIGPGYQFISGLSEPETWKIGAGFNSDPGIEAGAFRDPILPGQPERAYIVQERPDELDFVSADGAVHKRYQLSGGSLKVMLEQAQPTIYRLPLVFDPWLRFSPDWSLRYHATAGDDSWRWGLENGTAVLVESNSPMQLDSILDSLAAVGQPEDPNQEYPPGHWLPFPMASIQVQGQSQTWLTIRLVEGLLNE
jgi:hypothetical protein